MVIIDVIKKNGLIVGVGLGILALLTFALVQTQGTAKIITLPLVEGCKLQTTPCSADLPMGGKVTFEISPKNPTAVQTLDLDVHLENIKAKSVRIKFNGKTMNMAFLEYNLKPQPNSDNIIHYSGKGGFSVCVLGKMEWIVTASILIDNTLYEIPFELDTYYTGR